MQSTNRVQDLLSAFQVPYKMAQVAPFRSLLQAAHQLGEPPSKLAQATVIQDRFGLLLAVYPANRVVDFKSLKKSFNRNFVRIKPEQFQQLFGDMPWPLIPPLGDLFGLRTVIDDVLLEQSYLYFSCGDGKNLVRMACIDFERVTHLSWRGGRFSKEVQVPNASAPLENKPKVGLDLRKQLNAIDELPPLPETAARILRMSSDDNASIYDLAEIVESDPSLAAQVVRYANSPFFNYRGDVFTVHDAISRVLGFNNVLNIALGLAAARPFRLPRTGKLGLNSYWRHAAYSAALTQALAKSVGDARLDSGLAYLCGLLHNFGYLVLGHLFNEAYFLLNKLLENNDDEDVTRIENRALGVSHGELGAMLLSSWGLPKPLCDVVRHHHDESYRGEHTIYVHLTLIANRLLNSLDVGESGVTEIPPLSLQITGISESQAVDIMNRVLQGCDGLNNMARQLVA